MDVILTANKLLYTHERHWLAFDFLVLVCSYSIALGAEHNSKSKDTTCGLTLTHYVVSAYQMIWYSSRNRTKVGCRHGGSSFVLA
jgi:hypothetical protein